MTGPSVEAPLQGRKKPGRLREERRAGPSVSQKQVLPLMRIAPLVPHDDILNAAYAHWSEWTALFCTARRSRWTPASLSRRRRGRAGAGATSGAAGFAGGAFRRRDQSLADGLFTRKLPCPPNRFGLLAGLFLRRLLVGLSRLHLAENAFTLHLLLEGAKSLVDVVVSDENLQRIS